MKNLMTLTLPLFVFVMLSFNTINAQPFNHNMTVVWPAHTVVNPCNGEEVSFPDTEYHVVVHGVIHNNGTMNFHGHANANLVGTTEDGTSYQCITTQNYHFTQSSGSETDHFNQHLISQGGAPNFWFNGTINIHVNANGDVTVNIPPTGTATCSGN